MQLHDAEKLALRLMREFKLIDDSQYNYDADWTNWHFEWDDAKRRFGCCWHDSRKITLSRELVIRNEQPQVEDVIRHEIAHALTPPTKKPSRRTRRGWVWDKHGADWKRMCKKVGANPERCYDDEEVETPEGEYQATCGVCHFTHHKHRAPKGDRYCVRKECLAMMVPYTPHEGRFHPARKLNFRHKNAPVPKPPSREAIEAMKAQMRREQEMEEMKTKIAELEKKLGGSNAR